MFGLFGRKKKTTSNLDAVSWIVAQTTDHKVEPADIGVIETDEGRIAAIDPLVAPSEIDGWFFDTPKITARLMAFKAVEEGRISKLAVIWSDASVAGGADVGVCLVDAGMSSFVTPKTHAALISFCKGLGEDANPYDDYFCNFDDPKGGEHKQVPLPSGTLIPYVHSGWGDGAYPVFVLTDAENNTVAAYVDFMGCNEDGDWLAPPGVKL